MFFKIDMLDLYKEIKEKKKATPKQLAALEKAREARKKKKAETFIKDPEEVKALKLDIQPIPAKEDNKVYSVEEDAEPPLWFKKFISQRIEEKVVGLTKNKATKKHIQTPVVEKIEEPSEPVPSVEVEKPKPGPAAEVEKPIENTIVEQSPKPQKKNVETPLRARADNFIFRRGSVFNK